MWSRCAASTRAQTFYADSYLWLRFNKTGLDDERIKDIIERLEPINGKFESKEVTDDKTVGDQRYVCYRVTGTFFFVPDLKNYPFDTQVLPITVENATLIEEDLSFVDDRSSYEKSGTPEVRWGSRKRDDSVGRTLRMQRGIEPAGKAILRIMSGPCSLGRSLTYTGPPLMALEAACAADVLPSDD